MKNIIKVFIFLIVVTGVVYPLMITAIGQAIFPFQANGSILKMNDKIVGSKQIAQEFKSEKFFHPRPSGVEYNPMSSGASNLGPVSKKLKDQIDAGRKDGLTNEMLFTSGSGLDPHISFDSALLQVDRIVKARGLDDNKKQQLIEMVKASTIHDNPIFFGSDMLNVLELNIKLETGNI
jgi:K+-transporting ATPase ATPase C chain